MRLSAQDFDDPIKGPLCCSAMVMLDGKFIDDVIVADEEEGYVEVYQRDRHGNFILDTNNQCAFSHIVYGVVQIIDSRKVVLQDQSKPS